jgi:hypothetical protein
MYYALSPAIASVEVAMLLARAGRACLGITRLWSLVLVLAFATTARAESITVLTVTNNLLRFDSATPGTIASTVAVTGLQALENLLAIDFRPATGTLFGLGSSNRLYQINTTTGVATAVGSPGAFTLSGFEFGFDFNPTVDRIRVTSDADQNIRLNPNDGSLTAVDVPLNPGGSSVTGSAYTNNFAGALTTTLFAIGTASDVLMIQNPPNGGVLTTVGPLGVSIGSLVGFDISGISGIAYAAFASPVGGTSQLYTINLSTGAATLVGTIGGNTAVRGLAAPIGTAAVPEPATLLLVGSGAMWMARRRRARRAHAITRG